MKDLKNIKFWLFDLDNTLYDGATKVFDQVDKKMSKFISEKLSVSLEEARKIQKNYFQEYNTTLNGMIKNELNYSPHGWIKIVINQNEKWNSDTHRKWI